MKNFFIFGGTLIVIIILSILIYIELSTSENGNTVMQNGDVTSDEVFPVNNTQVPGEVNNQNVSNAPEPEYITKGRECFQWYVDEFMSGNTWIEIMEKEKFSSCFSTEYSSSFEVTADNSGADPVLNVQNHADSWSDNLIVKDVTLSGFDPQLEVQLGSEPEKVSYIVNLTNEGGWKISFVQGWQ